jgi:hypothetical protein
MATSFPIERKSMKLRSYTCTNYKRQGAWHNILLFSCCWSFGPLLLEETQQEQLAWINLDTETLYMQNKVKHKNQHKAEAKGEFPSSPLLQYSVLLQSCRKDQECARVYIHGQIRTSSLMSTKSKPHMHKT